MSSLHANTANGSQQISPAPSQTSSQLHLEEEDLFHVEQLRFSPNSHRFFGTGMCTFSLGSKPDLIDRIISITCLSILVLGLVASLILAASDPLQLGDNYLESLYRYLSVISYAEALLLVIIKVVHPAKDAIARVLKFQSRKIPSTIIGTPSGQIRLEGNLVNRGPNNAADSDSLEVIDALCQELDPSPDTIQQFVSRSLHVLSTRAAKPGFDRYVCDSIQITALQFILQASALDSRSERMQLFRETFAATIPSTQTVSGNDCLLAAIARLSVEDNNAALDILWDVYQDEIGLNESTVNSDNGKQDQQDKVSPEPVNVPRGCVLRDMNVQILNKVNQHFERLDVKVVVEFLSWSMRFGFKRHETLSTLNMWETVGGTLLTKMSFWKIVSNEPLYFLLQLACLALYGATPWTVALLSSEGSYISKAADAAGIGTAVMAGFAYVSETFWPAQRLLWAALHGMADVRDLSRLAQLLEVDKAEVVRQLVEKSGFFSAVGENLGACSLQTKSSPCDTLLRVGGVTQIYERYEIVEINGEEKSSGAEATLSPCRMVSLSDEYSPGRWHEEGVDEHSSHMHVYVLSDKKGEEPKEVWGR